MAELPAQQRARNQLATAGETAADTVGRARNKAPENQSWLGDALDAAGNAAETLVTGAASLDNPTLNHPTLAAGIVGSAALKGFSTASETAGVVLDATKPAPSTEFRSTPCRSERRHRGRHDGASMAGLASEVSGDDETEVVDTADAAEEPLHRIKEHLTEELRRSLMQAAGGRPIAVGRARSWQAHRCELRARDQSAELKRLRRECRAQTRDSLELPAMGSLTWLR